MIYCQLCRSPNPEDSQFCNKCGHKFLPPSSGNQSSGHKQEQPQGIPKSSSKNNLYIVLAIIGGLMFSCLFCGILGAISDKGESSEKKVAEGRDSSKYSEEIEWTLQMSDKEKSIRTKKIQKLPAFSKVKNFANENDFSIGDMTAPAAARKNPSQDSLTGLNFLAEGKRKPTNKEQKIVLMGPTKNRVDTVRFQVFGKYTRDSRNTLLTLTKSVLEELERGEIPSEFERAVLAGKTVGNDEAISNGKSTFSVLQSGTGKSDSDRISVDLAFDDLSLERASQEELPKKRNKKVDAKREETKPSESDLTRFRKLLRGIDKRGNLVSSVRLKSENRVEITVTNTWHLAAYQVRLQAAQNLWKAWAGISSPGEPDKARIVIVDFNGNRVGGSRILGGSLIWVNDK